MRKRSHISGSHVGRVLMWSCGTELCLPQDSSSLARQGGRRLAQHRGAPLCTTHSQPRPWGHSGNTPGLPQLLSQLCCSPCGAISSFLQHLCSHARTLLEGLTAELPQHPLRSSPTQLHPRCCCKGEAR